MSIGDNIKAIRTERKLTQVKLAKEMGISRSYLSDIENNRKNPSSKTLETLSEKLGVSMFYITSGKKTLKDLSEVEANEQLSSVSNKMKTTNDSVRLFIEKYLKELLESELGYVETQYLANVLVFLRISDEGELKFLNSLIVQLNKYKNMGSYADAEQESLLEFIDGETKAYNTFLKQYYGYKEEGE